MTVDPYKDSGLSSECVISTDASLWEVGEANALTVSVKSQTSTSYEWVTGTRTIFTVTANKWGTYELSGWAQGFSRNQNQTITCWLTYNVTVVDNGGGVYKDYDVCHYSNGVHYHFDRNDDAANTLTLKHVINGANENHMHGYPALDESKAVTAVSIPSTFTSGSVSYTVTRIDGMFASSAVSGSYNDALNKITKVTVPSTIKSVSDRAFIMGMGGLKTVVWNSTYCVCTGPIFPTTVTSITFGSTARRVPAFITANTSVASLTVPETITQVSLHAFSGTKLKTLVFNPTKCSFINLTAFAQYTGTPGTDGFAVKDNTTLTTLTWNCPEFTFSYGNPLSYDNGSTLDYVKGLETLIIGDAITDVDGRLFNNLPMKTVTLPEGLKTIAPGAFGNCGNLATVNLNSTYVACTGPFLPASVTKMTFGSKARRVPAYATAGTSIASLTVPETITQVSSYAFSGTKLKTLVFNPTKCSVVGLKAFAQYEGTPGTDGFAVKDNTTLTKLTWNCPEFTFSYGNPLSYDNGSTLDYVKGLETLIIGDAITDVDGRLFNNLPMKTVTLPEGLKTIAPGAFGDCGNLATVNVNSTYVTCSGPFLPASVTKMTFGSTARRVPAYATAGTSIASLTVPATMTQVGSYAFSGSMLKTLVFNPTKCSVINLKAFAQYTGTHGTDSFTTTNNTTLTTLTWNCPEFTFSYGNPLTYDNGNVLDYVKGIDKLIVGDAIINVPDQLFSNLPMKSVEFSSNVKTIGLRSFENCSELREMLVLPSSLTAIGARAFAGCSALRGPLVIPVTVSSIGASAFEGCSGVSSIHTRPVKTLGKNAFLGTSGYCFIGKTTYGLKGAGLNPTVIYITATTPPECDASTFAAGCDKTSVPVNVPQASAGAYSSATEWKDFTGINGINMVTPAWDIPETFTLTVGQSEMLPCVPASATDFVPAFYSTDDSIVQIDGTGRMTAMQAGEVDIVVTECLTRHICHVTVGSGSTGVAGDLDGSGLVDVDDVNELINYILGKSSNAGLASIADIDGSGLVDVDDVNAIINIILSK